MASIVLSTVFPLSYSEIFTQMRDLLELSKGSPPFRCRDHKIDSFTFPTGSPPLSNAPAVKPVEKTLVIGHSILRNVNLEIPATIVSFLELLSTSAQMISG